MINSNVNLYSAFDWLQRQISEGQGKWSLGAFGAMGIFEHSSPKSAIRLENPDDLELVAFETISSDAASWNHAVAICLTKSAALMSARKAVASLGPDVHAIRDEDRGSELFDLGLGYPFADVCLRTRDEATIQILQGFEGQPITELSLSDARLDHVFITRAGRLEMLDRTGLPPIIPSLLKSGNTHAVTSPIPEGFVPCGYFFPPHPLNRDQQNSFDPAIHVKFQRTFCDYGLPPLRELKGRVLAALKNNEKPDDFSFKQYRFSLACIRVTLRQQRIIAPSSTLDAWQALFEKASTTAAKP